MFTVKVGVMPGRLSEVVVPEGISAREIFNLAEVTVSNHEVRLDGNVIDIDTQIQEGKLLVAMKQIKGNANTIKVGTMPGRLQELEVAPGETARELFARAGITISNHEIRLDGGIVDLDSTVSNGKLLVSMKQIKGNRTTYSTKCTQEEVEILLGVCLPAHIDENDIEFEGEVAIIDKECLVSKDLFLSLYEVNFEEEKEVVAQAIAFAGMSLREEVKIAPVEEHVCTCKSAKDIIEKRIENRKENIRYYQESLGRLRDEIYLLEDILAEMN